MPNPTPEQVSRSRRRRTARGERRVGLRDRWVHKDDYDAAKAEMDEATLAIAERYRAARASSA